MKIYISADIEGTTGITDWEEATKTHPTYMEFRERMTDEVVAACEGAIEAGAREILVKDAHSTGRNIIAARLPDCARLIRGWSGHPFSMVQELDESFDALLFVGYHAKAGSDDNPLAHTLRLRVMHLAINGEIASEFQIHSYAAALVKVPAVFLSGDAGICADAQRIVPGIVTVPVSRGIGPSTLSIAPGLALKEIREGVTRALKGDRAACRLALPGHFTLEIQYTTPVDAYRASWYPGARLAAPRTVQFDSDDYFEVLRAIKFMA
ncbi:MAG TPA: M55 family metallopeptidase [Hypericibacter adhaerens]|jgi:D-amino peptidase|uniref:M55 family metallopeptidase n=1 Tax=Hypericibacter adhaerens TaxID=2602016 RepID=UPI002C384975|nr:M55 family metallopeptidase [Hypericibacter adhaerens]HWA42624.1 M55 family metallopeptidase [Hypericibacter adhaerens]